MYVIQTQFPPVDEHLMELLIYIRTLRDASAGRITAVMPYFPYARSDKKDHPRVCIAARLIADLVETAGADRVIIMEMHSPQMQGFFSIPCDHLVSGPEIVHHLRKNWDMADYCLVAGDAGAAKMLKLYADGLQLPVAIMDKRREGNNEQVTIKGIIGEVRGKKILLLDDETSTGRTLMKDADFLLKYGGALSVDACFVHAALGPSAATSTLRPLKNLSRLIPSRAGITDSKTAKWFRLQKNSPSVFGGFMITRASNRSMISETCLTFGSDSRFPDEAT